ncbi:hypothetical protein [Bradymonas sediminis]|nr:hypothetical protein [Bradymonas sediminis]
MMGADESIRFEFSFHGINIELSGESKFVDTLYRELMRDIEAARQTLDKEEEQAEVKASAASIEHTPVWVHRCSEMMRKVYMSNVSEMKRSPVGKTLDYQAVRTFYTDDKAFRAFFPKLADNRTMWAELTDEGQRTIRKLPHGGRSKQPPAS